MYFSNSCHILYNEIPWNILQVLVFFYYCGLIKIHYIKDKRFNIVDKSFPITWAFVFSAITCLTYWTIAIFTTILRGRRIALSFSVLHTSTTRCTANWIFRPFPKYTIYRAEINITMTCFSLLTSTVCTTIQWNWIVTFSCATLNSTATWLGTFWVSRPFSESSINRFLIKMGKKQIL